MKGRDFEKRVTFWGRMCMNARRGPQGHSWAKTFVGPLSDIDVGLGSGSLVDWQVEAGCAQLEIGTADFSSIFRR